MPARPSQTGARILRVLEALATHQPAGARALARILDDDKSAVHRSIMTLAQQDWVRRAAGRAGQWEVSPRMATVAGKALGDFSLRHHARPVLERLRDASGETVVLIIPDVVGLIAADVVESRELLRVVFPVGSVVAIERSAAGRAILSRLSPQHRAELLGREPDQALLDICAATRARGYAISERETLPGATSIGCALIGFDGHPCGAISVIGPCDRVDPGRYDAIGRLVMESAANLSPGFRSPATA